MPFVVSRVLRDVLAENAQQSAEWAKLSAKILEDLQEDSGLFSTTEKKLIEKAVLEQDYVTIRNLYNKHNLVFQISFAFFTAILVIGSTFASFGTWLLAGPVYGGILWVSSVASTFVCYSKDTTRGTNNTRNMCVVAFVGYTIFLIAYYNWEAVMLILGPLIAVFVAILACYYTPFVDFFTSWVKDIWSSVSSFVAKLIPRTPEKKQAAGGGNQTTNASNTTEQGCAWDACDATDFLSGVGGFSGLKTAVKGTVQFLLAVNMSYLLAQGSNSTNVTTAVLPSFDNLPPIFEQQARLYKDIGGMRLIEKKNWRVDIDDLNNKFQQFIEDTRKKQEEEERKKIAEEKNRVNAFYYQIAATMVTAVATNIGWKLARIIFWKAVQWFGTVAAGHPGLVVAHVVVGMAPVLYAQYDAVQAGLSFFGMHTAVGSVLSYAAYEGAKYVASFMWDYANKAVELETVKAAADRVLIREVVSKNNAAAAANHGNANPSVGAGNPPPGPAQLTNAVGKTIGTIKTSN
jgi:hypothetical protein